MTIGILGTGGLAATLGSAWAAAGHSLLLTGRNVQHAREAVDRVGRAAEAVDSGAFASRVDAVVVAVAWDGLDEALSLVGASQGSLDGKAVIDCTNPVDFTTGDLSPASGSAAELVARTAPGAHVVKALHLFPGVTWPFTGPPELAPVVAICGDQADALERATALIGDLGGRAVPARCEALLTGPQGDASKPVGGD